MPGDAGQRARLEHLQVEPDLADVLGQRLVEVLERGDEEGLLAGHPQADVPADLGVEALAVQDPPGGGDLEARIALADDGLRARWRSR